tara:strand:- start:437 stop:541 length:105 start_codon:yes stop_codon:yes gene_type:complete
MKIKRKKIIILRKFTLTGLKEKNPEEKDNVFKDN